MSKKIRLCQVKCGLNSTYTYLKDKEYFRLKIIVYSSSNEILNTSQFTSYNIERFGNKKVLFDNINLTITNNDKILVNIKHIDGSEQQRAIYFDEIEINGGSICL